MAKTFHTNHVCRRVFRVDEALDLEGVAHVKSYLEQPQEADLKLDREKSTLNNLQSY